MLEPLHLAIGGIVLLAILVLVLKSRGGTPQLPEGESELLPASTLSATSSSEGTVSSADEAPESVLGRLARGLARTKGRLVSGMDDLFRGKRTIDEELWSELERLLIGSDVGVKTAMRLLEEMRSQADREELEDSARLREILAERVRDLLSGAAGTLAEQPAEGPLVIMVVGVNGAGKTTTIGKLAARYVGEGKKVVLAAGDTFRAAAIEQIMVWGKRSGAQVVKHEEGGDPAAVAHDGVTAGLARGADVVICDTAGRLHSKAGLMDELTKVHRVVGKVCAGAPHETLLVLDSTNGQNAIAQAKEFSAAVGVTGIALTKLDGTAKGGVILGIADALEIPVKLIGIGEAVEDLRDFEPELFAEALFISDEGAEGLGRGANSAEAAEGDTALDLPLPS